MKLVMGSQAFINVEIPLLWGTRAVVQDRNGRLSIIDLSADKAKLEILGDKPAPGIEFVPTTDGFKILSNGKPIYGYNPNEKTLTSIALGLPDCQVSPSQIRVGTNVFSSNMIVGSAVGIAVTADSIAVGAPLPPKLARLVI